MQGKQREGSTEDLDAEVIVVGGGPTGMVLAAELALGGVDVLLVERRADQSMPGSRAGGMHARTLEMFDQRGIVERFLAAGEPTQTHMFGPILLDLAGVPTPHPYGLALPQARIEALLAEWVAELPVRRRREASVEGVEQDAATVTVQLADGTALRAAYAVGCDGGRSTVRRAADIGFEGTDATTSYLLAEATMTGDPPLGFTFDDQGRHAIGPLADGAGRVRLVVQERPPRPGDRPTAQELADAVLRVWAEDFGLHSPTWISRFSDAARQATAYRAGRVFLAGDAAHVHSPLGGQGLGTGVQDAFNLGWKLAEVVRGIAPEALLDTYHRERHPVGEQVLEGTLAQTAFLATDPHGTALRNTLVGALELPAQRDQLAGRFSALALRYDLGEGHPLVGRRVPDVALDTARGRVRMFALLHAARPVLVDLRGTDAAPSPPEALPVHVDLVPARADAAWELPIVGAVPAPAALLVRPDGYVAWAGDPTDGSLRAVLGDWFGPPKAPPR
ncbi:MAG: FAD-dependent monooxygenase [Patulibacter sp.]|nr:FAD-dependent monooxygenase [Patulibacter sp.]